MNIAGVTIENRVILFTDVHNFTLVSMAIGHDAYGLLQEMYETLGDIIIEHRGEIVKYMGDAMLGVFAADAEREAVACARQLRQAFARMVSARRLTIETELEIGIGSGEIAIGEFGHRSLRQKDVFGEEVNRAAVIGHHRGIAITERVCAHVSSAYPVRRLPDFRVKWQTEPLQVWEVSEQ
jgi:adenylate cyclase